MCRYKHGDWRCDGSVPAVAAAGNEELDSLVIEAFQLILQNQYKQESRLETAHIIEFIVGAKVSIVIDFTIFQICEPFSYFSC